MQKKKKKKEFLKVPWMPESLSGSVVWWWSYTAHVYAVYACGWFIISNKSSGYGEYNNVLTNLPES